VSASRGTPKDALVSSRRRGQALRLDPLENGGTTCDQVRLNGYAVGMDDRSEPTGFPQLPGKGSHARRAAVKGENGDGLLHAASLVRMACDQNHKRGKCAHSRLPACIEQTERVGREKVPAPRNFFMLVQLLGYSRYCDGANGVYGCT
jgi:hypothetical protein